MDLLLGRCLAIAKKLFIAYECFLKTYNRVIHKHATATAKPPYLMKSFGSFRVFASNIDASKTTITLPSIF